MKLHPKSRKESSLSDRDGDFTFPTGKERLYDRTLKALVLADMSLSQHSQATFPRQQATERAASNEEPVQSITYDH